MAAIKKHRIICLLLFCMIHSLACADGYWSDEGNFSVEWYDQTASSFSISMPEELAGLAVIVNKNAVDFSETIIYLTADIDLSAHEWVPIAFNYDKTAFKGTFDGAGYSISGLYVNKQNNVNCVGLFGNIREAKIKNLTIVDAAISFPVNNVAGIAGNAFFSYVENCSVSGSLSGSWFVSGIVGYAYNTSVVNCINYAACSGEGCVGGIGGSMYDSPINDCINEGSIYSRHSAGGLAGFCGGTSVMISDSYNSGPVGGISCIGGVMGTAYKAAKFTNISNRGTVIGEDQNVGGIVGITGEKTDFINVSNAGTVAGNENIGGIAGFMAATSAVNNSYNNAPVAGVNNVGGIAGYCELMSDSTSIRNSYNAATVTADANVGGILGFTDGEDFVVSCVYRDDAVAAPNAYGNLASEEWMQSNLFLDQLNINVLEYNNINPSCILWKQWMTDVLLNDGYPVFGSNAGIADIEAVRFRVYPNPAVTVVTIEVGGMEQSLPVRIYDMLGQLVATYIMDGSSIEIDVEGWKPGAYIFFIRKSPYGKKIIVR
ncbi:MAG: T9SS type A sorting domain-containing protein [Bacteroidales bacterium]|nr:T9SS type A sorting domain-containing protein [Bacteroidales bacterium]